MPERGLYGVHPCGRVTGADGGRCDATPRPLSSADFGAACAAFFHFSMNSSSHFSPLIRPLFITSNFIVFAMAVQFWEILIVTFSYSSADAICFFRCADIASVTGLIASVTLSAPGILN